MGIVEALICCPSLVILIVVVSIILARENKKDIEKGLREAGIDPKDVKKVEEWKANYKKANDEWADNFVNGYAIESDAIGLSRYLDDIKTRLSYDPALKQKLKREALRDFVISARSLDISDQYIKSALKSFCSDNESDNAFEDAKVIKGLRATLHSSVYYSYTPDYERSLEKSPYD